MRGNCGECERRWFCEIDPDKCDEWPDPIPMTNADRIRAMTDEELAEFMDICEMRDIDYGKTFCDLCDGSLDCDKCRLDWLQQPCGGADHERNSD